MAAEPGRSPGVDSSFEVEVELGPTSDLDAFLAERGEAMEKIDNLSSPTASDRGNSVNDVSKGSPQSVTSDDIEQRLTQLQSLLGDEQEVFGAPSSPSGAGMPNTDGVGANLAARMKRMEQLLDDQGDSSSAAAASPAAAANTSKGDKAMELNDFGSPVLSSKLAASSAVLSSAPADQELESRLARLTKLLDDNDRASMASPAGLKEHDYISGEELGRGLLKAAPSAMLPEWHTLNSLLREHGFSGFPMTTTQSGETVPDTKSLRQTMRELLTQWERRGEVVQELMLQNAQGGAGKRSPGVEKALAKFRARDEASQRALQISEARLAEVQESLSKVKERDTTSTTRHTLELGGIKQQLKQSEHRVKAKEQVISRLQERLQMEAKRHEMELKRSRDIFKKFRNRDARPSSAVDSKTLEIVRMYETQRDGLVRELSHLRREVKTLNLDIKDRENIIHRRDFASSFKNAPAANALLRQMETEKAKLTLKAQAIEERETSLVQQLAKAHNRVAKAELFAETKNEENTNLRLELQSRPTTKAYKLLQQKLKKLTLALEASGAEDEARENWKRMDTRTAIKRDRDNARLKLNNLAEVLSKKESVAIIKDLCRELNVRDPALIIPGIEKINRVMHAVPRMQEFIKQTCSIVCPREERANFERFPAAERMKRALGYLQRLATRTEAASSKFKAKSAERIMEHVDNTIARHAPKPKPRRSRERKADDIEDEYSEIEDGESGANVLGKPPPAPHAGALGAAIAQKRKKPKGQAGPVMTIRYKGKPFSHHRKQTGEAQNSFFLDPDNLQEMQGVKTVPNDKTELIHYSREVTSSDGMEQRKGGTSWSIPPPAGSTQPKWT
jgi:hypothetical protein